MRNDLLPFFMGKGSSGCFCQLSIKQRGFGLHEPTTRAIILFKMFSLLTRPLTALIGQTVACSFRGGYFSQSGGTASLCLFLKVYGMNKSGIVGKQGN